MRWLRCVLSREFDIQNTLIFWDYIFGGIDTKHRFQDNSILKNSESYLEEQADPLINLDYLCTAMIIKIQDVLLDSDFSMCMAYLLNYPA